MKRKRKIILHFLLAVLCIMYLDTMSNASIDLQSLKIGNSVKKVTSKEVVYSRKGKIKKEVLVTWVLKNSECSVKTAKEIVDSVIETRNPLLLLSIMQRESKFNSKAISDTNCMGLGQVSLIHIKELKEQKIIRSKYDLIHIRENTKASDYILGLKLKKSRNNIRKALFYYVGDLNRRDYVASVLRNYSKLQKLKKEIYG